MALEGCGICTQLTPCPDPQAGCYVNPPRVVDPAVPPCCATPQLCGGPHPDCDVPTANALFSGPHGDYTIHAVGTCDDCTPGDWRPDGDDVLPVGDGGSGGGEDAGEWPGW